jgi:hypothetical protein
MEIDIMNKDLSNMTPFSKAFWSRKKQVIIDNVDMPRATRSLDFSSGTSEGTNEDVYVPESPNNIGY